MEMTNAVKKAAPASALILLVICVDALVVVGACMLDRASQVSQSWLPILAVILMTATLGGRRLLGKQLALVLNDLIAIGSAVMTGPAIAVLAVVMTHLLLGRDKAEGKDRFLCDVAGSAVAMNVATQAMAAAFVPSGPAQNGLTVSAAVAAAVVCAVFYFSLAAALSTTYRAFSTGESFFTAFKDSVLWNAAHLLFTRPARLSVYLMRQWHYDDSRRHHKSRIGEVLVSRGLITQAHLRSALAMQRRMADRAQRLGEILVEMGVVDERQVLMALSERSSLVPAVR